MKSPASGESISNHEYHHGRDWSHLVSSTQFKLFCEEPAAFRWSLPFTERAATDRGTATHSAVLEPEKLDDLVVLPDIPCRSNADKDAWRAWLYGFGADEEAVSESRLKDDFVSLARHTANATGKSIVNQDQLAAAKAMAISVSECEDAAQTIFRALIEKSYRAYGLRARPDILKGHLLSDLKTCAQLDRFKWAARDLMYPLSLAFYEIVLGFCGVEVEEWSWIVVESSPYRSAPDGINRHRVQVVEVHEEKRLDELSALRKELEFYLECKATDTWPTRELPRAILDV